MNKQELKEVEQFLEYLKDKVEECYKREVEESIKEFLKEYKSV